MTIKAFRELRVYQGAFEAAMALFRLSSRWPAEERYNFTSQIRRSSRSVCGTISEAWRKRRHTPAFISKLSDADAEAGETLTWLSFARECGYLESADFGTLKARYEHICAQLVTMMGNAARWCGRE